MTLFQLTPEDLAARLTLDDYEVFRAVQSTEYIDEVFGLTASASEVCLAAAENGVTTAPPSPPTGYATGHENLDRFTELVNREAYWAPTEICNETNLNKRVDLLKRFIKLAKFCRELRNFNTMFCILVGLHQTPVERLKQTWERLPNKYQKLYRDLSMILDTSRNFFQYRTLLTADDATAPMLPYLPLVLKDLTFIHLGNPSRTTDGLINFVKLRMLAKEIRAICRMCNVDYDLAAAQRLIRRSAMSRATRGWTSSGKSPGNSSAAVGSGSASAAPSSSASSAPSNVVTGPSAQPQLTIKGVVAAVNGWDAITNSNNSDPVVASGGGGTGGAVRDSSPGPGQAIRNPNGGGSGGGGGGPFARRRSAGFPLISGFSSSHAAPANPKKLYDAWLTALRIRTYLANLNVVRDSDMLSQMSSRLEPDVKSPIKSPPPVSPTLASTTTAQSLLPTTTPTPTATSSTASSVTACASNSNPTSMKMTASPNARLSNTATTSAPSTNQSLVRPILGAQSVEDARKLLALSEYQKRQRHHRMPAFTFPASRPTQFVFVAPPPTGQTTHTGVGLGQLQYAHPVQRSSSQPHGSDMSWSTCPAYASAGPAVCPAHPALATATMPSVPGRPVQQACCYTLVGSKTLLLDNLIPMPQRIGPNVPMRSSTGTPVQFMNQQQQQQRQITHYAVPNAHSYPHAQTGQHSQQGQRGQPGRSLGVNLQTQQQSQYAKHPHQHLPVLQQMRLNSQTRQSTERKTAPQPAPLQQQQQQHVSNPAQSVLTSSHGSAIFSTSGTTGTIVATRAAPVPTGLRGPAAPPPPTPHPAVLTQFVVNGSQKIPSGRTAGRPTDDTYHYPTANTHPLGLSSAQIQHNKQINAHRIGQQQQVDWKPNRPPPYELALALRQMQPTGQSVSDQCNSRVPDAIRTTTTTTASSPNGNTGTAASSATHQHRFVQSELSSAD
ncbi:RPGF2 [Fasciola gigantica]|uniref:RPGF2 n=1 Tax=Fasciola gigantica TaxID=46835 RepID=A0A504Z271_FASGI|nr:RPGF2 [Fasciola gigantica]